MPILNLGTGHVSWWVENGIGCHFIEGTASSTPIPLSTSPALPENLVHGCILQYYYVETIQAGVQCILSVSAQWDLI